MITRLVVLVVAADLLATTCAGQSEGLAVINEGTEKACLTYEGKPLFAFGPINEHILWQVKLGSELYNVTAWACWQQANGMNYVRCYPASGYGWTHDISDHPDYLFPFEKVSDEPVRFDLARFNEAYWQNFRAVAQTLRTHGIIVHLQVFQLCYFETSPGGELRWPYNFWNPVNNVNDFARSMGPNGHGHHPIIEQVADGQHPGLREHYLSYLDHLLAATGDLGNVFFDLSNEMGDGGLDVELAKQWVELTLDHVEAWERETGHDILVGQDFSHFPDPDYLLRHPRMELIIAHGDDVWHDWTGYRKPVVIVNSADGRGLRYADPSMTDRFPRFRKLHWRALLSRAQGLGDYQKEWKAQPGSFPEFDRDAQLLRAFFDSLVDYPNLLPHNDCIVSAPGAEKYCLASQREAVAYLESGPATAGVEYGPSQLVLQDLPLWGGEAKVTILSPTSGAVAEVSQTLTDGRLQIQLPAFTDDLAIHLLAE